MKRILRSIDLIDNYYVYRGKEFHVEVYYRGGFSSVIVYNDQIYYVHHYLDGRITRTKNETGLSPLKKYLKGTPWH